MKKIFSLFALIAALAGACVITGSAMTGCKSPPQRLAFNSITSVEQATSAAFDGYMSAAIDGTIASDAVPKIASAFNKFQKSYLVALDGVQYNTNALAPPSLIIESQDVINLINQFKGEQ